MVLSAWIHKRKGKEHEMQPKIHLEFGKKITFILILILASSTYANRLWQNVTEIFKGCPIFWYDQIWFSVTKLLHKLFRRIFKIFITIISGNSRNEKYISKAIVSLLFHPYHEKKTH